MKVAFLDRDGTINLDYPDEKWNLIREPKILEGSIEGMKFLLSKGYKIIILTNQYIIGDGIISIEQYYEFTNKLLECLKSNGIEILDIFFCPHSKVENCDCCKPKTGMMKKVLKKYPEINLEESFFCGDSKSDMQFAKNCDLKFYGINIGKDSISNLSDLKMIL
ncbi:MAG: HAD-IIIA family hydrolase [Peptoniphilus sp.]|uniref:D-glycero-alpha-D-manno-heptose-1,7-bisphosphate 7-phosphatase n=1 Tax=Peptoniphilus sp. TaxID=1971214 RepID=UPI002A748238|nr:HAD-IIIA family hydrolase [Peptoniphilus sp.]MDY2986486.1 HAD-IIIA family hydrolase [Peptoniphilus sp.]